MASVSAIRSPSALSRHRQNIHQTNGSFAICSSVSSPVVVGHNLYLQSEQQQQYHHQYSSSCCSAPEKNDEVGEKRKSIGVGPLFLANPAFRRNTLYFDTDFSSPTSWEFKDNCRLHCTSYLVSAAGSLSGSQMPAASSPPVVLPLPLASSSRGSSSANSSLSTTPSPLDELGPGSPYQVQTQLRILGQTDRFHTNIPLSTSSSAQGVKMCVDGGSMVVSGSSNEINCDCVFVSTPNATVVVVANKGMDGGCDGDANAPLHSHDLTNNGSGSDGSRNSTGSNRSQDSGFSDSGETRKKKSSLGNMHTPTINNDLFYQLQTSSPVASNGSSHQLHHNQNSINACAPCQSEEQPDSQSFPRECEYGSTANCCGDRLPSSPAPLVQNGQLLRHSLPHQIYECIPNSMPSPILPSGFGCGRLASSTSATPQHHHHHPIYGVAVSNALQTRPTSLDMSTLDRNCSGGGGALSKVSSLPSFMSYTACSNCLPSSISVPNGILPPPAHGRSFSPSSARLIHRYPFHSHDVSALASSSTATAIAALQVPLSSSTPKRGSSLPSNRRVSNNNNGHGVNMVVKIDNFESLNKNVNVNMDNNNNCSDSGGRGAMNRKTGNKTFTIKQLGTSNKSSTTMPYGGSQRNQSARYGMVLAEEEHTASPLNRANSGTVQESEPAFKRTRSAAESIYDKICSRLSSLSSSTSSTTSSTHVGGNKWKSAEHQAPVKKNKGTLTKDGTKDDGAILSVGQSDINFGVESSHSKSNSSRVSFNEEESRLSSGSTSRFELFTRTSSAGWQSLPKGVNPQQLSLVVEEEGQQQRQSAPGIPSGECENNTLIITPEILQEQKGELLPSLISKPPTISDKIVSETNSWNPVKDKTDSQVVRLWLHDLRTQTEPECLHSLQTKWIVPAEFSQGEEDEENEGNEIVSVDGFQSSTTSSNIASNYHTIIGTASSATERSGRLLSLSSVSHHPTLSSSPTGMDTGTLSFSQSERDYRGKDSVIPVSSNIKGRYQQHQRRSQQKFLSSMTAAIHAVATPLMSIRNVEMTANTISGEFSKICKHLEFGIFTQVPTLVLSLVGHLEDFLRGIEVPVTRGLETCGGGFNMHLKKLENRLANKCYALDMAAKGMSDAAILMNASDSSGGDGSAKSSVGYPHPPQLPPRPSSTSLLSSHSSTSSSSIQSGSHLYKQTALTLSSSSSSDPEPDSMDRQYHLVVGEVVEGIVKVGNLFSQVVDLRLTRDLASILDTIEGGGIPARIALKSLATVLADGGSHICKLSADIRTVRGLLGVLLDTREDQDKILALRCLATVLCVGEAVRDFDKAGGFEIVADILYDPLYSLWVKIEAVAVLAQATDPWIDLETTLLTLSVQLEKFMVSLTNLIREFKTEEEPFLLIVAAISNLTFLEVASTEYLKKCRSVSYLMDAVKRNPGFSVFVLDHIATILANMAGVESCRQEIIHCGGIDALLQFLQQRPCLLGKTDTVSAITACERLQQKSTIAISRLANEDGVAHYIFNMGGVHRLVTLCRKEKERNYSDGVLIAALATLRKIVTICGDETLKRLSGAEDLIEPRLLDSFLLYSSRQESYV